MQSGAIGAIFYPVICRFATPHCFRSFSLLLLPSWVDETGRRGTRLWSCGGYIVSGGVANATAGLLLTAVGGAFDDAYLLVLLLLSCIFATVGIQSFVERSCKLNRRIKAIAASGSFDTNYLPSSAILFLFYLGPLYPWLRSVVENV